jgi:amidase
LLKIIISGYDNQEILELCEKTNVTSEDREAYISHLTKSGRDEGVNKIFEEYGINIIMGPLESPLYYFAAACGSTPLHFFRYHDVSILILKR